MAAQSVDFHGLSSGENAEAYSHAQNSEEAKRSGNFKENRQGIRRPVIFLKPFQRPEQESFLSPNRPRRGGGR
jgi:hypothetical protein